MSDRDPDQTGRDAGEDAGRHRPLPGDDAATLSVAPESASSTRIGPYHLLERIGTGGMGEVYLADQQTPVRRRVALKLIKVGMDTKEVVARFASERQALAMMNHPGIAKIYDAGMSDTGRPYFVMEYVAGVPITDYCDRYRLSTRERLDLLVKVCQAVQHAHQKGIIHRDLKPSNVLVVILDGQPVPKIIDFGVAKALDQRLTADTIYTAHGQMIGTPAYMSPEQADRTGLDIDTTSDVYSLGVMLYELLTGDLPFGAAQLKQAGLAEIQRLLREVDPPRPSVRISSLGLTATRAAEMRHAVPHTWLREIRGDLDWITMRALEKDRTRRYQSASELAADIERHLGDEVVAVGPPATGYRLRKFVRRHRGLVTGIAAVVATLAIGLVVSWTLFMRAESARRAAEYESYVAVIGSAQLSLDDGDAPAARRLLDSAPPDLRSWEWHQLDLRSDTSVRRYDLEPPFGGGILLAPDGLNYAASDSVGVVRMVDLASGSQRQQWIMEDCRLRPTSFSRNGQRLLMGGVAVPPGTDVQANRFEVRNVHGGSLVARLQNDIEIQECLFSGDGSRLAGYGVVSVTFDGGESTIESVLQLWNLPKGKPAFTIRDTSAVSLLDLNRDGSLLAVSSASYVLSIFDGRTGARLKTFANCRTQKARFDPAGRWIFAGEEDGRIRQRDLVTGAVVREWAGSGDHWRSIAMSGDGRLIAVVGDRRLRIWDSLDGAVISNYELSAAENAVSFASDGNSVLTWHGGDRTTTVHRWDPFVDDVYMLEGYAGGQLAFSPDGRTLIGGSEARTIDSRGTSYDSAVREWDVASGVLRRVLRGHSDIIGRCRFDATGKWIFSTAGDETLRIWDAASGACLRAMPVGGNGVVDSRGELVAASRGDSLVIIVTASGDTVGVLDRQCSWGPVAFDAGGHKLIAALPRGFRIWRLPDAVETVHEGAAEVAVRSLTISPDGEEIALGADDGSIHICEILTGKELRSGRGNSGSVGALSWHPEGGRLAVAGEAGIVIWDAVRCRPLLDLTDERTESVSFSPDGKLLAAISGLGENGQRIRIWRSERPSPGSMELRHEYLDRAPASALVDSLFAEHLLMAPVLDAINRLDSGQRQLQAEARRTALVRGGDPEELVRRSLALTAAATNARGDYLRAREYALAARGLNPRESSAFRAIGMAEYRLGAYGEALTALKRADALAKIFTSGGGHPTTVAFLAMAYSQLGNQFMATAELDRLRAMASQPSSAANAATMDVLSEASKTVDEHRRRELRGGPGMTRTPK